jgi:hypothetical protein
MIFAAVRVAQPQIPSSAGPAERQGIRSHGRVRGSGRSSPGSARATETTDATADAHDPDLIPPGDSEEFDRVVASFGETTGPDALRAAAADLTLTADELARIERLASLLKPTPRALKRFANVYMLLKSLGRGRVGFHNVAHARDQR